MNGPFVVAQANPGTSSATPVQVLKLIKPQAGQTDILHATFNGAVKIDFTAIANEKITLFHDSKNQSLHVIFADGSQIIIEPFFDSRGTVLDNFTFEMGPNVFFSGQEFAQRVPITEDPSVLPAAGGTAAGADFHGFSVDGLPLGNPLDLLPPEELPGLQFTITGTPLLEQADAIPPVVSGHLQLIVEEEELRVVVQEPEGSGTFINTAAGNGNEDTNDVAGDNLSPPPGNDEDTFGDFSKTTKEFSGDLSGLVSGGGPFTFLVNNGANGAPVLAQNGVQITSLGDKVVWEQHGTDEIWGVTVPDGGDGGNSERTVFILHVNTDGTFTFTLTDQIDHDPAVGGTPTDDPHHNLFGSLEETIFIDLSVAIGGHNAFNLPFTFPQNTVDVGVIDDTPIVKPHANECVTVDEDDIKTHLSHGTSPNDGNHDGSFTGDPGSNGPGPAFVCGDLSGLVRVGADAVSIDNYGKPHGTFSFNEDNLSQLESLGLSSKGYLLEYHIEDNGSSQTLVATAASGSEGGYERTVFTLELFSDGKYEFKLFDQMDHDPPYDTDPAGFVTHDPFIPGNTLHPPADQNTDLIDNDDPNGVPRDFDVSKINFGALIEFSDYDHDTVSLDGVFEVRIRDDIPEVKCGETICLFANEDDIDTNHDGIKGGSLGTSPDDGNFDGSYTGAPGSDNGGPATVFGNLNAVVIPGADECLTFSFINEDHAVDYFRDLGLKSKGEGLSYDIQGNVLYAFVQDGGGFGSHYDAGDDRLVFTFTLDPTSGDFTFRLYDQMDHDPPYDDSGDSPALPGDTLHPPADQNLDLVDKDPHDDVTSLNFGHVILATDFDGDSVSLDGKVEIKIVDDIPQVKHGEKVVGVVEEEQLHGGNEDNTPDPLDQDPPSSDTTNVASGSGSNSLASLINVGADENGKFTFKDGIYNDTVYDKNGQVVTSKGDTVKIKDIDTGHDSGGDFTLITAGADGRDIFTLKLYEDGDWRFELKDQVDHHPFGDDVEGIMELDLGRLIEFSDFDHDTVCLDNCTFLIKIIDDVPIAHIKLTGETVIHDETPGDDGNDDTNSSSVVAKFATLEGTGQTGDDPDVSGDTNGATLGNGAIGYAHNSDAIVESDSSVGADAPGTVSFRLALNGSPGMDSGLKVTDGSSILLEIFDNGTPGNTNDDMVVGRVSGGAFNGKIAFAVAIDNDGELYVAQYLSIRHDDINDHDESNDDGTNNNDDQGLNQSPNPIQQTLEGKINAILTITDEDGDQDTDQVDVGKKVIFQDDGPKVSSNATVKLDDDDLSPNGLHNNSTGDDPAPQNVTGTLNHNYGADGPGSIALLNTIGVSGGAGFTIHSNDGTTLIIQQLQNGSNVDVLQISINGTTGGYTVTQLHAIDHSNDSNENNVEFTINYRVTDGDGDWDDGSIKVNVDDDMPDPNVSASSGTIIHDETSGQDLDANDVTETFAITNNLANLFSGVTNKGNDPDVNNTVDPAIGYAQQSVSAIVTVDPRYGADGPGSVSYGFNLSSSGVDSGLRTTDGHQIFLFQINDHLVVGRFDGPDAGTGVSSGDPAAFAINIDPSTGLITLVQYESIKHDDRGDNDEANDNGTNGNDAQPTADLNDSPEPVQQWINNSALQLTVTVTDHDGDDVTKTVSIGNKIIFQDDGPSLNIVDTPNAVDENQSINGTWTLAEGADGVTSVDVTIGGVTKTLSIPSGVLGADPLSNVTFTAGDGAFGTLVVKSDGTWTYTAGSISGGDKSFAFTVKAVDGDGDPASDTQTITIHDSGTPLIQSATFSGFVEEEQLFPQQAGHPSSFTGIEDQTATPDNDSDTANSGPGSLFTTNIATGFETVIGGVGPYTYHFNPGADQQAVFTDATNVTSHGSNVLWHYVDGDTEVGYVDSGPAGFDAGDRVVFQFDITNTTTGAVQFTLFDNIDHPFGDNIESTRTLNLNGLVNATDSTSPTPQNLALNGSVGIIDDIPVATQNTATVSEGGGGPTNFILVVDTSASMTEDPGVPGFPTRFQLEQAALINLLNSANVNQVFIVGFGSTAYDSGQWLSKAQAINFLNFGLSIGGFTNYDAALTDAQTAFDFGHTNASQTLTYFLSDGEPNLPNGSVGIDATEQAAWENFLNTNGVGGSFAIGVGNGATLSTLDPIAYPNGDPTNPVVLTDQSQLAATLIGTLPGTVDGNVLTTNSGFGVDGFGADGPGAGAGIVSISVDGHLYVYNAVSNAITKDGNPFAAGTSTLDVITTLGGHLTFHFNDGVGFSAGDWHYQAPTDIATTTVETFHYVIADGDGDQAGADLNVTVTTNDAPHAVSDIVLTNLDGVAFNVPEWVFLHNDFDPNGNPIDVTGVLNINDLTVTHTAGIGTNGFITIDDEDSANGGSFDYTISNGSLSDTASVSVINKNGGGDIVGTSSAEILVGDGNGNTFNGAGGGDVILAGGGNDTLIGGGGADYMQGGTGADHFRYNATSEGGTIANQLGADHILDFSTAENDSIDILVSAFGGGLIAGTDATGIFGASGNDTFGSSTERFHFNTATHTLLYDSNGSNAGGTQVSLAVIENSNVDAAHIHMV